MQNTVPKIFQFKTQFSQEGECAESLVGDLWLEVSQESETNLARSQRLI